MANLFIVDDYVAYREAFAHALEREAGLRVVQQASSLAEARESLSFLDEIIDFALVGQELPDGDGTEIRPYLVSFQPRCHLVVLRAGTRRRDRALAIAAGAMGIFPRSASLESIVDGIRRLTAGELLIPRSERLDALREATTVLAEERAVRAAIARLTPRELEILQALADGLSDKEIAERLNVSAKTVASHMTSLLKKLSVESRLQAALAALRCHAVTLS